MYFFFFLLKALTLIPQVMLSVVHIKALTRTAMASVHMTVTMMAATRAFLGILRLMTAVLKMVEDGGSVVVAQLICMEIGTLRGKIVAGHLASTGSPGDLLSPTQLRQHV